MHPLARARRRGFTLIEVLISMTVLLVIVGSVTTVYRTQIRAIGSTAGRFEAVQNLTFIENAIDRELRLAGGTGGQPIIVSANPMSIVFNVDLVSRQPNDRSAVYYNPDADSLATEGWDPARQLRLPLVNKIYPLQFYVDPVGNRSTAETVAYFLRRDANTLRNDTYTLFRRVNDRDSTVVARNIQVPQDTVYFFRYWRTDATGNLTQVPFASLPLYWDDIGHVADSIRVVDFRLNALYHDAAQNTDALRSSNTSTKLLNAGLFNQTTCGTAPLPPRNVAASLQLTAGGAPWYVHVTWDQSLEEQQGEKDVALYLIQRRIDTLVDWEPLFNVPANASATYTFNDYDLSSGTWVYSVVAQDCSPANSAIILAPNVIIP